MNTLEEYALKIGKFWVNFNTLELLLRVYLTKHYNESEVGLELEVSETCEVTHLTNYDTFEVLARKYNSLVDSEQRLEVTSVARLRDALAHGRVTTKTQVPMTVIKYSKPQKNSGKVLVEFKETLSAEYFDQAKDDLIKMITLITELLNTRKV